MRTESFTCDKCQMDITTTDMMPAYRIAVACQALPNVSSVSYSIYVTPPIKGTLHFCGPKCMKEWINENM